MICYSLIDGSKSTCNPFNSLVSGDTCQSDMQCHGQLECSNSICKLPNNTMCQSQSECAFQEYCMDGRCYDKQPEGSVCTHGIMCQLGTVCSPISPPNPVVLQVSFCVAVFSKTEGQSCRPSYYSLDGYLPAIDCNIPLVCLHGSCQHPPPRNRPCMIDSDCENYQW
ncbi:hypothetical protein DFA_11834 [Cavenderia fasciculata]|uniref:EB domain-containing protein n=1 Tax=Cavenderia fasciculata TaxID=261658 RepID=F4QEC4_CACFS|nr:uncharacterized protein DFA_11834 [Cavenderia fasciculata]EGG14071.1 hypothetical protein DFA_11834 [Cavenderia fasciculata]|eukprot:XP_004350779.1 hypothetical protein DFA_11834 [Cavenderia fasciculata]